VRTPALKQRLHNNKSVRKLKKRRSISAEIRTCATRDHVDKRTLAARRGGVLWRGAQLREKNEPSCRSLCGSSQ
jgi:hypothetical protein